ncbi:NtaA/DmoA family FMN-dependent monooxygenase [Salarchaeum sp. III]|uniref:NtaA/DmoA family FMN-dependent monooxygenase n=1 Tax=Salarchaeum sp. III TaxID=3107927 RepID=UPI002ED7D054
MSDDATLDLLAYANCSHSPAVEDAWRLPEHRQPDGYRDIDFWQSLARRLDGAFSALFFADAYNVANTYEDSIRPTVRHGEQLPENDPLPLLSALAAATDTLGLVTTASTSFYPPYLLAKKLSTIDDLTDGRLGWNVVTSSGQLEFENVVGEYVPHDERYDRADDHLTACYGLWMDSWDDDAVVRDAATGTYADPDRVRFVDHDGPHHRVRGPHMTAPTPQRTPVVFQAGQSERGREFAAKHAEATFAFHLSRDSLADATSDLDARARDHGRTIDDIRVYPAITPYVAPTDAAAEAHHDRVIDAIDPETGLVRLSNHLNHDYSQYDRDSPLEDIPVEGIRGALNAFLRDDREWTVGDAAARYARYPTPEFVGTPESVADDLEAWMDAGADGFVVMAPVVPKTFTDVIDYLLPELDARGLAPTPADGTLRETLGFDGPRPASTHPSRD